MSETYSLHPRRSSGCLSRLLGGVVVLVLAVCILLPSMGRAREPAKRVHCQNNLRQIAFAIKSYADANGGELPPDLGTVLRTQGITASLFVCPSGDDTIAMGTWEEQAASLSAGRHLSYVYLGAGHSFERLPQGFVLAYDVPANHDHKPRDGGSCFVFADFQARYIPRAQPVIDQLRAGQNPPVFPAAANSAPGGG